MKQTGLGGFRGAAGAVGLGLLSGDAVAVGPSFGKQGERVRDKAIMPSSALWF
jgi:hypothetical protein